MLAIIKEECGDFKNMKSIHPVLFPLLLLISRLQPLSTSQIDPSIDEISSMFIDPVISCLGHTHHKVRIVAARAVNVLCSGDDHVTEKSSSSSRGNLILKCLRLASMDSNNRDVCHNTEHGALLALKCLLEDSTDPSKYFNVPFKKTLAYYASWGYFLATCPPICVVIALEIWLHIHRSLSNDFELSQVSYAPVENTRTILDIALEIVRYVEAISTTTRGKHAIVGLSMLGSTASRVAIELLYPCILNETKTKQRTKYLKLVESLLCSENFDIMLHSVKTFKKKMWNLVEENAKETSNGSLNLKIASIHSICGISIKSLQIIFQRDGTNSHPPTLRRITRCILETAARYRSISSNMNMSHFTDFSLQEMFHQLSCMLSQDITTNSIGTIAGNVLELMALMIPELSLHLIQREDNAHVFEYDINLFLSNIFRFSDSNTENWKLRLSAAESIKQSRMLISKGNPRNPCINIVEKHRIALYFRTVQLLQDNDDDVYRAAACALYGSDMSLAALRRLERGYNFLLEKCNNKKSLFSLLSSQIASLLEVNTTLCDVIEEYKYSLDSKSLSEVLNLSSKRRIFEEENTSAYDEVSL